MKRGLEKLECGIAPAFRGVKGDPAFGHAGGEDRAKGGSGGGGVAAGGGGQERGKDLLVGGEVEVDGLAWVPVRGDLQDGGTREASVGEEKLFAEGGVGLLCRCGEGGCDYFGG